THCHRSPVDDRATRRSHLCNRKGTRRADRHIRRPVVDRRLVQGPRRTAARLMRWLQVRQEDTTMASSYETTRTVFDRKTCTVVIAATALLLASTPLQAQRNDTLVVSLDEMIQ